MKSQHRTNAEEAPTEPPAVETLQQVLDQPVKVKLQLLQHYAEMARLLAGEIMDEEVETLAGERYSRDKPCGGRYRRWGQNPGSIRIDGERVPVDVPRVRDVEAGVERPLQSYRSMKEAAPPDGLAEAILLGLSQGDYQRVAGQFIDGFGLSQSSVSRRFQQRAEEALQEFEGRPLEKENFLALWIDGKHVAGEQMIISVGVTEKGHKRVLGFTQATTERAEPIKELFRDLLERGLSFDEGILCVVDGGRGVRKAIDEVFGRRARVQRCQWLGAGERGQLLAEGRPEEVAQQRGGAAKRWRSKEVAQQAPACLSGAVLRGSEGAPHGAEGRAGANQPKGRSLPGRRAGGDAHASPAGPVRRTRA